MKKQQNKKTLPNDEEEKTIKKTFVSKTQQVERTQSRQVQQPQFKSASKISLIDETRPVQDIKFLEFVYRICNLFPVVWLPNPEVESLKEDNVRDKMSIREFSYDVPEINFVIDKPKQPTFYMQFVFSFHPSQKFMFRLSSDDQGNISAPYADYQDVCVFNGLSHWGEKSYDDFLYGLNSWCQTNQITFESLNLFCQSSAWNITNFKNNGMYVVYDKGYSPALTHYVTRLDRSRKLKHQTNLSVLADLTKNGIIQIHSSDNDEFELRNTQRILQVKGMERSLQRLQTDYADYINDVI